MKATEDDVPELNDLEHMFQSHILSMQRCLNEEQQSDLMDEIALLVSRHIRNARSNPARLPFTAGGSNQQAFMGPPQMPAAPAVAPPLPDIPGFPAGPTATRVEDFSQGPSNGGTMAELQTFYQ